MHLLLGKLALVTHVEGGPVTGKNQDNFWAPLRFHISTFKNVNVLSYGSLKAPFLSHKPAMDFTQAHEKFLLLWTSPAYMQFRIEMAMNNLWSVQPLSTFMCSVIDSCGVCFFFVACLH